MNFAVIETGGKQYKVSAGSKIKVEKLHAKAGETFKFDKVLLTANGDAVSVGAPYVSGAAVEAKIVREGRDRKKIIFKYHSKARFQRKKGHRQSFTEVEISKI
jgi:large subunit ribosomal protein L21